MTKLSASQCGMMGAIVTREIYRLRKEKQIANYLLNPAICVACNKNIPYEKRKKKFCGRQCSGKFVNKQKTFNRKRVACLNCKTLSRPLPKFLADNYQFCRGVCHSTYVYKNFVQEWLDNKISAVKTGGTVSQYVRRYLKETFGEKCVLCGWDQRNPFTHKIPLVLDHKDGDCLNGRPENLRLICPNCNALTATSKGANKGKGRASRGVVTWKKINIK